jgi:pimeloyl-ACP methyl ester carboxylesterase
MELEPGVTRPGALGALTLTAAAGWAVQRRHLSRIGADPVAAELASFTPGGAIAVRSPDGTVLHVEVFGPEDAPTIVLAHGWAEALRLWAHQIRDLSRDFRVVAYDQRGHGRSGRARTRDYSVARLGEDLDAVLATCVPGHERAIVAGHSMGAMAIAAWAEHHDVAGRIRAAALLNTGVGNLIAEHKLVRLPLDALLREPFGRRVFLGNRARLPHFSTPVHHVMLRYIAFGPTAGPATIEFMLGMVRECRDADRAACGLAIAEMELHHALDRLTVPTLVMAGEVDRLTPPSHAHRMAARLPDLTDLIILPATGHMGPLERPAEYSAALRALAEREPAQLGLALAAA